MYGPGGFYVVELGDIIVDRYIIVHKLGYGGYASVWLVLDTTESQYVTLKILSADSSKKSKELEVLQRLGQLNVDLAEHFICPLLNHFQVQGINGVHTCLIMPWAGLRVMEDLERSEWYTNEERIATARYYTRQLAHGLALLHSVGIVHGDLTVSNILMQLDTLPTYSLDDLYSHIGEPDKIVGTYWAPQTSRGFDYLVEAADLSQLPTKKAILIADFGEAFLIQDPPLHGLGTPLAFAPPEGFLLRHASPASDIWALGCLAFHWWSHSRLFSYYSNDDILRWMEILSKPSQTYLSQHEAYHK